MGSRKAQWCIRGDLKLRWANIICILDLGCVRGFHGVVVDLGPSNARVNAAPTVCGSYLGTCRATRPRLGLIPRCFCQEIMALRDIIEYKNKEVS